MAGMSVALKNSTSYWAQWHATGCSVHIPHVSCGYGTRWLDWLPHSLQHCLVLLHHRMRKLPYRVVFPFDLKLSNTTDDADGADSVYSLFAVVVHVGSGPHHGKQVNAVRISLHTNSVMMKSN